MHICKPQTAISVIFLSIATAVPSFATGHWDLAHPQYYTEGKKAYHYSGKSYEGGDTVSYCWQDGLRPVYDNAKDVQNTDCQIGESADTACPHFSPTTVAVVTTGGIYCTVNWIPDNGDSPPAFVWVKIRSHSGSHVWSANSPVTKALTPVYNSVGGAFTQTKTQYDIHSDAGGYRWQLTRTDPSSVTVKYAGKAAAMLDYCTAGHLVVGISVGIDDVQPATTNFPPGKDTVPWNTNIVYCPIVPTFDPASGGQLSGGDPVNLGTGQHLYLPSPDLTVYNPHGPDVVYQRNYYADRVQFWGSAPGLTTGWTDSYDVRMEYSSTQGLILKYPNGGAETLGVTASPFGNLMVTKGTPYSASGIVASDMTSWQSISILWTNGTVWTLTPAESNVYRLSRITEKTGHFISILRNSSNGYRVTAVTDDCSPANSLLTFQYSGNKLTSIADEYGRSIFYGYTTACNHDVLTTVSRLVTSGTTNPPSQATYGYQTLVGRPYLVSVTSPSPTGTGVSTESVVYDVEAGKVSQLVDANGNRTCFDYSILDATQVSVKTPSGTVQKEWTEGFDRVNRYIRTYSLDGKGCTYFTYADSGNLFWPTRIVDRDCQVTLVTYDDFGNILTTTDQRGVVTTFTYDYTADLTGRLTQIQKAGLPPTSFTYTSNGLPATITSPRPGTMDATATVTTTYTYDSLGNVLSVTGPGKDSSTSTTVTYNYTTDGTYTQAARKGQPLTVTDGLGHTTHYRYDARGNIISVTDALGNETVYTYNLADQKISTILPKAR